MESNMSLKFSIFDKFPELVYGFTEKNDGSMKIFDAEKQVEDQSHKENKKRYFEKIKANFKDLIQANLVAGNRVVVVSKKDKGKFIENTDALITCGQGIFLGITVADCFPIYFYNPVNKKIGLAHAGWRGIAKNIAAKIIEKLEPDKNKLKNILVGIGPGIRKCHYDIKPEVEAEFEEYKEFISNESEKVFIDLPQIIKYQLQTQGILKGNIEDCQECTFCKDKKYFSWRRERNKMKQAMAFIGIK